MSEPSCLSVNGEIAAGTIGAADSSESTFQKVTMKLTSKEDSAKYTLFVGPLAPTSSMGQVGDIAVQTQFQDIVIETANKNQPRTIKGQNHDAHKIYYKNCIRWRSIEDDVRDGERRSAKNKPYTIHPQLGAKYVLEEYVFRWRRITSYSDAKSRTYKDRPIEGSPPSNKRTLEAVTTPSDHEKEGRKRLRMETAPPLLHTTLDNMSCLPAISHEGNVWILKEYLLWNTAPLSNVPHTHDRGRDVLSELLQIPDTIPHGPAMKYVQLLKDADHGPAKPTIARVMHDLIHSKGEKTHFSKANFGFGSAADHVPVEDVLSSLCQAGDETLKISDPLLGALTVPVTNGGLGKCSLNAGTFEKSAEHVYECKRDKTPTWSSSINPRGSITDPHIDYCGCSQIVQHISGRNLWLFWPPTTHNLQLFCQKYISGTSQTFSMMTAIKEFENLEILLVEDRKRFIMPAGMIHAVITFTTSCHTGFKLWGFDDFDIARRLVDIHFEVWENQSQLDNTQVGHYNDIFGHLEKTELPKWGELCRKNVGDERSKDVLSWIKEWKVKLKTRNKS